MPIALFLDAAVSLFKRYRWLIPYAAVALIIGVQTWRLSHVKHDLTRARATIAQMEQASKQARDAQIAANLATEARYRAQAEKTDHDHQTELASAYDAANRFIAANRVRPDHSRSTGPAIAPAEDHGAGVSAPVPEGTVLVSPADVQACTSATSYAISAHEWAAGI